MSLAVDLEGARNDLEKAKTTSATKLRSLESVYRKNQIDAIMEMGEELSQLHRKYSEAGCKRIWKAEFGDLQLRMSRRTAERYRKIYNAFNDCPTLWGRFKLSALVLLAEYADKEGRGKREDAPPVCLNYIKALAVDWDGIIRRSDAEQYCQTWEKFADRPELLKWFTFEALKLLAATGNEDAISQAKYVAIDLEQDAVAGNVVELIGLDQAQAIIENFADDVVRHNDTESPNGVEAEEPASKFEGSEDEDSAAEDGSEFETEADDEADEPATAPHAQTFSESIVPSSRKYVKTYKLSKYDISIASDSGPVTPEEIESILDELRVIMQGEFDGELAATH
jgi:hypothetical protein